MCREGILLTKIATGKRGVMSSVFQHAACAEVHPRFSPWSRPEFSPHMGGALLNPEPKAIQVLLGSQRLFTSNPSEDT